MHGPFVLLFTSVSCLHSFSWPKKVFKVFEAEFQLQTSLESFGQNKHMKT